eukprot:TRINITY_DN1075_c0_g1_i1.p1 TRINITY_DN1075_c0_g1~~TRINITY_DN1075_c0_g1_i1.p1  ORF type:complete len:1052 (+),score=280.21 TRINITY_DN1075_c0_g1_i1:158-3313(+)
MATLPAVLLLLVLVLVVCCSISVDAKHVSSELLPQHHAHYPSSGVRNHHLVFLRSQTIDTTTVPHAFDDPEYAKHKEEVVTDSVVDASDAVENATDANKEMEVTRSSVEDDGAHQYLLHFSGDVIQNERVVEVETILGLKLHGSRKKAAEKNHAAERIPVVSSSASYSLPSVAAAASSQEKPSLPSAGHPYSYVAHNTFFVLCTEKVARQALDLPQIEWVGAWLPRHKHDIPPPSSSSSSSFPSATSSSLQKWSGSAFSVLPTAVTARFPDLFSLKAVTSLDDDTATTGSCQDGSHQFGFVVVFASSPSIVLKLSAEEKTHRLARRYKTLLNRHLTQLMSLYGESTVTSPFATVNVEVVNVHRLLVSIDIASSAPISCDEIATVRYGMVQWLSKRRHVHWIEIRKVMQMLNSQASWVVQSAESGEYSVHTHDLRGEGQIVGCADSGIDYDNCFYNDPDQDVSVGGVDPTPNFDHRKIVTYAVQPGAEVGDDVNGHGTHVAGSIAGNAVSNDDDEREYAWYGQGVAPNAKLAFLDIGNSQGLVVPQSLNNGQFFQQAYDVGARVHTNSWGCFNPANPAACNTYDPQAADVDTFMQDHSDFLILYAGGNDGDGPAPGFGTIGSPATCKSCLTVGASQNDFEGSFKNTSLYQDFTQIAPAGTTPEQCCENQNTYFCCPERVQDFYDNGGERLWSKNNLASFSSEGPANSGSQRMKPDVVAPGEMIASAHGDGDLTSFNCAAEPPALNNPASIMSIRGTSMATPVVAGAVALVRQYLVEGYYPTGEKSDDDAMEKPSGALLKAMMIASTVDLAGVYDDLSNGDDSYEDVPESPSFQQGFGRVQLDRVLYFDGSSSDFSLFVDDAKTVATGDRQSFAFDVDNSRGSVFTAVLVWTDPPGNPGATNVLVNDLNLVVEDPSGNVYNGNNAGLYKDDNFVDTENPVERVRVNDAESGTWKVHVEGANVPVGESQSFAIVATTGAEPASGNGSSTDWLLIGMVILGVLLVGTLVALGVWYVVKKKRKPVEYSAVHLENADEPFLNETNTIPDGGPAGVAV